MSPWTSFLNGTHKPEHLFLYKLFLVSGLKKVVGKENGSLRGKTKAISLSLSVIKGNHFVITIIYAEDQQKARWLNDSFKHLLLVKFGPCCSRFFVLDVIKHRKRKEEECGCKNFCWLNNEYSLHRDILLEICIRH